MRRRKTTIIGVGAALAVLACASTTWAAATLTLVPNTTCYKAGDTLTVAVTLAGAPAPIVGGQFYLAYNATDLTLTAVNGAGVPGGQGGGEVAGFLVQAGVLAQQRTEEGRTISDKRGRGDAGKRGQGVE